MDIFEQAARVKLRFETTVGLIGAEDLFDLPLSSKAGRANLDDLAIGLYKQLKSGDDISFVDTDRASNPTTQLRFDIVKRVIDIKKAEHSAIAAANARKMRDQQIMAIIADKEVEGLKGKSVEELRAIMAQPAAA